MIIYYKKKRIILPVKKASFFGKLIGLMFKSKSTDNLLFEFDKGSKAAIHSYFVFFNFLAIWLDQDDKVVDWKLVKPFTAIIKPKDPSRKLVEIPTNRENYEIINFFVGKERFK